MVRRSRREKTLTDYDEEIEAAKAKIEQAKAAKAQLIADMQTFVGEAAIEMFGTDHFTSKAAALRFFKGLEERVEEAQEIEEAQEEAEQEEVEENTTAATEVVTAVAEEDAVGVDGDVTADNGPAADGASDDAVNTDGNADGDATTNHFDPESSMAYFQR